MNQPELTNQALQLLRNGEPFQWHFITLLSLVVYVYMNEYSKKNWNGIAAGLSLYMVHWFYEISNSLIQHFSGHALWTVPTGTSYLLLIGVCWEISMMFAISGIIVSKMLPEDPDTKIMGINVRLFLAIGTAALYSLVEIFLASTPAFHWVYNWWGSFPVFVTVYIPFFMAATYSYYWTGRKQLMFIGGLFSLNAIMLIIFAGILKWI